MPDEGVRNGTLAYRVGECEKDLTEAFAEIRRVDRESRERDEKTRSRLNGALLLAMAATLTFSGSLLLLALNLLTAKVGTQ